MGHEPDSLILTSCQHSDIGCPDALGHLQQGFAAWWGAVELITLPGGQALGILLLNLGIRQTFPASKGHLPQAGFGVDMQGMRRAIARAVSQARCRSLA